MADTDLAKLTHPNLKVGFGIIYNNTQGNSKTNKKGIIIKKLLDLNSVLSKKKKKKPLNYF